MKIATQIAHLAQFGNHKTSARTPKDLHRQKKIELLVKIDPCYQPCRLAPNPHLPFATTTASPVASARTLITGLFQSDHRAFRLPSRFRGHHRKCNFAWMKPLRNRETIYSTLDW